MPKPFTSFACAPHIPGPSVRQSIRSQPWAAYFWLLVSTSNHPYCGHPACPTGNAGMEIVTGFFTAVTGKTRFDAGKVGLSVVMALS